MAYKRKYPVSTYKRNVRRRSTRRMKRRVRRFAQNKSWTIQTTRGQQSQYRSRKLRKSTWRRKLWNDTLAKTHYRSAGSSTATIATGATIAAGSVTTLFPTFIGVPSRTTAFWTVAGGLQTPDTGETAPTFSVGDMVIRGGRVGVAITCPDAVTSEISVVVYVVRTMADPEASNLPTSVPYGVYIDSDAEFTSRYGKVLYRKSAVINNAYPLFEVEHRLKVQKIDQEIHAEEGGYQDIFIITAANLTASVAENLNIVTYHDLSFSADAAT